MTDEYRPVAVWDRKLRFIHWVIAFSVLLLIPLGLFILFSEDLGVPEGGVDNIAMIHVVIGGIFAAGVLARVIYLFTGPPEARWTDIFPRTGAQRGLAFATIKYYLSGFKGKVPFYFSHNPFAGLAYTLFFIFAITQAASGLTLYIAHINEDHSEPVAQSHAHIQAKEPHGKAMEAGVGGEEEEHIPEWAEELHEIGALVIIFFVLAHFAALGVHDIVERRGLVSSMISGYKFFSEEELKEIEDNRRP